MRYLPHISAGLVLFGAAIAHAQDVGPVATPSPVTPTGGWDSSFFSPISLRDNANWLPSSNSPNWADNRPFQVFVDQSVRYNDNVLLLPKGAVTPANFSRGDWSSLTTVGASSRVHLGAQTFFARGNFGLTRYAQDHTLNTTSHLVEGGWDWVFTSRCRGRLVAADRRTQAPIEQLTLTTVNNIETASFDEKAKCAIADHVNIIADSGLSRTTNSLASISRNDYDQYYLRGGVEYEFALLNSVGVQATLRNTDFFNRSPAATPGLSTELEQKSYEVFYRRMLSPKLEFDGTIGVTETTASSPVSSSTFSLATYSARLRWQATPKTSFAASSSLKVGPPQNIIADYERIYEHSLSVLYLFSPKLSFTGSVGFSTQKNPTASGINQSGILVDQNVTFAALRAIYHISPFMNASADYRYTHRDDETTGLKATANVFMLGLTYQH